MAKLLAKSMFDRIIRVLMSVFLIYYAYRITQELIVRYQPVVANAAGIPETLVIIVFFLLISFAAIGMSIWRPGVLLRLSPLRRKMGFLRWAAAALIAIAISWLFLYSKWSQVLSGSWMRFFVYFMVFGVITWLLTRHEGQVYALEGLLQAGILFGSIFALANELQTAVSYPFSLSWSEGNRLWDYSALFGRGLYDYPAGKSIYAYIDRGRQSLWGLPFLFGGVSIFTVRLWSALLFTVPYFFLGMFVFFQKGQKAGAWLLASLWAFLFLHQGPIYTPLILVAIVVAAARRMPVWLGVIAVGLAGYYASISRSTWIYTAGMWAALLAFVGNPPGGYTLRQRWTRAIVLGFGGLVGGFLLPKIIAAARAASTGVSISGAGMTISKITSSLTRQPLLWERLLPNTTYAPGILLGLLFAAGPLVILLIILARKLPWKLDALQKLLIFGELFAFLGVGIIVSVKIGGGSNLHNLDMFLITLVLLAGLLWETGGARLVARVRSSGWLVKGLLALVVLYPASQGMMSATPLGLPSNAEAQEAVASIQRAVAAELPGEILFIDQRQLLTFGAVQQIPLIAEYEKKLMMDMAMADNAQYFRPFYADLEAHRFSLIISEPLWANFQGGTYHGGFGNENDAWVKWVSIPVLCAYEPVEMNERIGVQLLKPRQGAVPQELAAYCAKLQ